MNRYRTIPGMGPQKASANTTCQKCLQKDKFAIVPSSHGLTLVYGTTAMNAKGVCKTDRTPLDHPAVNS